jgi:L-threonylcarbamoyladenylate synthase
MVNSQFLSGCSTATLEKAASQLVGGHLVAFPTETVYGLGADATNEEAVNRIYKVKGRPSDHPLIVHISSISRLEDWTLDIPGCAIELARQYWPGPMTLILKRSPKAKDFITGGQDTVGLRVPNHPIALALLKKFESLGGSGIAAPSANRFGQVSPTSAKDVEEEIGKFLEVGDLILDGGASTIGIESTIIDCTRERPNVLRPGAITSQMIAEISGLQGTSTNSGDLRVSGSFERHYAPRAKVILDSLPVTGQGLLALSNFETPDGVIRIASPASPDEFAHVLYSSLRKADQMGIQELVVIVPRDVDISDALLDRLIKASNRV